MAASALEEELWQQITADPSLPWPQREFQFAKPRRWRFDFGWESERLAVEVQGGTWSKSTHGGGARQTTSFEKLNTAAILGWKVVQVNEEMIKFGTALALIRHALQGEDDEQGFVCYPPRPKRALQSRSRRPQGTPGGR